MDAYRQAFEEGVEAAKKADRARKEIMGVFQQFAREAAEVSSGRVVLSIEECDRPQSLEEEISLRLYRRPDRYHAIVARNPRSKEAKPLELAEWKPDRYGYPCTVTWDSEEHACQDRESLERCLALLAKHPYVGEVFLYLMHAKVDEGEAGRADSTRTEQ